VEKKMSKKNIMSVKEASGVCKDRVKWRATSIGGKNKGR
jgi:hypothetical protein